MGVKRKNSTDVVWVQIWDTTCRQIIDEFGDVAAYSLPLCDCSGFIMVGQTSLSIAAPFLVTFLRITDDGSVDKVQVSHHHHHHHHNHHHHRLSIILSFNLFFIEK